MPYSDKNSFELASYKPLQRILDSDKVRNLESRLKVRKGSSGDEKEFEITERQHLESSAWQPDMVLAIDGSKHDVSVENGFPSAEYGYVTVASVLILLDKIRELEKNDFINPVEFRKTEKAATTESAYPGCNVIVDDEESAKSSMRKVLFEELQIEAPFYEPTESNKETLLETYEYLLKVKRSKSSDARPPKCPVEDCEKDFSYDFGVYKCKCEKKKTLFSSDALRLHELHNDAGSCGEMYGQIMFTLERLWLVHILRGFEKQGLLKSLKNLAFIIDGSLAVFSTPSWLAKPIEEELIRINLLQKEINNQDLIILGIEKSGQFVNHFEALDTDREGISDKLPSQSAILLTDSYIKKNIKLSDSPKPYGQDTYFGRKFFYKTNNGYRVTANIAVFNEYQKDLETAYPNQFPRLADVMSLLDQIVSSRFQNSVSPLLSAHAEASIPLNLGKRIFQEIAREIRSRS
jgi:hypothetical protein